MLRLTLIVAATKSNGIGQSSRLPWRLPKEMKYFAQVTSNAPEGTMNAVIMGRNTWESIPKKFRPLPNRKNIVVSSTENYVLDPPAHVEQDLTSAFNRAQEDSVHRVFIIGGAKLYTDTIALPPTSPVFVDRVLLTRIIEPDFECDVFMPDFLTQHWQRASHEELETWVGLSDVAEGVQEENGVKYEFQMWTRQVE